MQETFGSTMTPPGAFAMAVPPPELEAYFAQPVDPANTEREDIDLNLLERAASAALTEELSECPAIWFLGGIVLDDANLSNYHVYLTRAPFEGAILFWQHDDQHYVAFKSLAEFLAAVDTAKAEDESLHSLHVYGAKLPDQAGLVDFIHAMLDGGTEEHFQLAHMAMACLEKMDVALMTLLLGHPYFFFAESIGSYIAEHPDPALRPLALRCAEHAHHQVKWAGDRALEAIKQLG